MDRYIYVELVRTQILTVDLLKRYFRIPFIQGKV
jgi:hypothetical protein